MIPAQNLRGEMVSSECIHRVEQPSPQISLNCFLFTTFNRFVAAQGKRQTWPHSQEVEEIVHWRKWMQNQRELRGRTVHEAKESQVRTWWVNYVNLHWSLSDNCLDILTCMWVFTMQWNPPVHLASNPSLSPKVVSQSRKSPLNFVRQLLDILTRMCALTLQRNPPVNLVPNPNPSQSGPLVPNVRWSRYRDERSLLRLPLHYWTF